MSRSGTQPSWRRLVAATLVVFATVLAFLAGRVNGGSDPALNSQAAPAAQSTPAPDQSTDSGFGTSPGALPQEPSQDQQPAQGGFEPPRTHAS